MGKRTAEEARAVQNEALAAPERPPMTAAEQQAATNTQLAGPQDAAGIYAVKPEVREAMWAQQEQAKVQTSAPLSIPALTNPTGTAREYALAAAELLRPTSLVSQSRLQAIRLLNAAIALIGT